MNQIEDSQRKLDLLTEQKIEIQSETKKLELLTFDYDQVLRKELKLEGIARTVAERERVLIVRENKIDQKIEQINKQRRKLQDELLSSAKIEKRIKRIEDRAQMEVEDAIS